MSVADTLDSQTFCGGRFLIKDHGLVYDRDNNNLYAIADVRLRFKDSSSRDSVVVRWYAGTISTVALDDNQLLPQLQSIREGQYLVHMSGVCFSNLNGYRHRFGMVLSEARDGNNAPALVIEWDNDQPTIETLDEELQGVA